MRQDFQAETLF